MLLLNKLPQQSKTNQLSNHNNPIIQTKMIIGKFFRLKLTKTIYVNLYLNNLKPKFLLIIHRWRVAFNCISRPQGGDT